MVGGGTAKVGASTNSMKIKKGLVVKEDPVVVWVVVVHITLAEINCSGHRQQKQAAIATMIPLRLSEEFTPIAIG